MDQLAAVAGRAGHALLIDCRTLDAEPIPMPEERAVVLVCDSGVRHRLAASAYNDRRGESEAALRRLARDRPERRTLRDVEPDELAREESVLDPKQQARARHVVGEIARTRDGARALRDGRLEEFGALMNASHRSLRDDYEVSAPELDTLAEAAVSTPGVYGSRMTGGGFGGCTVSLVRPDAVPLVGAALETALLQRFGRGAAWFVTSASRGASEVPVA
jgi:galactokinase